MQHSPRTLHIQRLDEQAQGLGEGLIALFERLLGRRQLRGKGIRQGDSGLTRQAGSQDARSGEAKHRIRRGHHQAVPGAAWHRQLCAFAGLAQVLHQSTEQRRHRQLHVAGERQDQRALQ
ncbi:hypothetical protein D3C81_1249420 [compost metagenome]